MDEKIPREDYKKAEIKSVTSVIEINEVWTEECNYIDLTNIENLIMLGENGDIS